MGLVLMHLKAFWEGGYAYPNLGVNEDSGLTQSTIPQCLLAILRSRTF